MSLKGDKYETAEEVRFRLEGTVVLYDKEPVYIHRVSMPEEAEEIAKKEIARVYFHALPYPVKRGKEVRKYLSSRNFDLSPFRMGYMNFSRNERNKAIFVARSPFRQNRQGLSSNNITFTEVDGRKPGDVSFANVIAQQSFVDMVHGKYPDFKEAGERMNDPNTSSVAISRNFAFTLDHDLDALILSHKDKKCGIALKGERSIRIPEKFHFLRQEMEEYRIPIA